MPITSVKFSNFKALRNYSVSLQRMNVLVGPNNSGSLQFSVPSVFLSKRYDEHDLAAPHV